MLQTEEEAAVAAAKGERRKDLFFNRRRRRTVEASQGKELFLSETAAAGGKCRGARRGPVGSGVGGKALQRPVGNDAGQGAAIEIWGWEAPQGSEVSGSHSTTDATAPTGNAAAAGRTVNQSPACRFGPLRPRLLRDPRPPSPSRLGPRPAPGSHLLSSCCRP
jgi:hypothetical protein